LSNDQRNIPYVWRWEDADGSGKEWAKMFDSMVATEEHGSTLEALVVVGTLVNAVWTGRLAVMVVDLMEYLCVLGVGSDTMRRSGGGTNTSPSESVWSGDKDWSDSIGHEVVRRVVKLKFSMSSTDGSDCNPTSLAWDGDQDASEVKGRGSVVIDSSSVEHCMELN
jgi:hypothetical protein